VICVKHLEINLPYFSLNKDFVCSINCIVSHLYCSGKSIYFSKFIEREVDIFHYIFNSNLALEVLRK
jgi:hypothetical protein